jgi:hypothetical protein
MGPLVQEYDSVAQSLRIAIEAEIKFKKQNKPIKLYKTLKDAVDQRVLAVHDYPGQQFLSRDAARTIVARAVKLVEDKSDREEILDESEGPVMFRHDRRQLLPSYVYSTREQVSHIGVCAVLFFFLTNFEGFGVFPLAAHSNSLSARRYLIFLFSAFLLALILL